MPRKRPGRARTGSPEPSSGRKGPSEAASLSAGKRAAFTLAMLFLPVAFFLVLEGGLRLAGYGADYPLFVPVDGRPDLRVQNREVARRYFVHQADVPNANADYFAAEKAPGTIRLIALGESSTAGFPFYWGAAFPRVLAQRLRAAYPDREVEVINTAMAAVNSYTLLDFTDEVLEQAPDAVVIYAGHNEYYGALGAASSESLGRNPAIVRAFLRLRRFRTVQLLRDAVAASQRAMAGRARGERPSGTLMARMIGEQSVPYGGEVFEAGRRQFRENMDALLARFAEAGVPVYVGTLASNERDQRPFVSVHTAGADTAAWRHALAEGTRSADPAGARAVFERATRLDTLAAEGFFQYGRALLAAGQREAGRAALVRARDLDALRFRAPESFNADLRAAAARHGARLVDAQAALRAASPDGVIGRETMMEHLHPTLEGYSLIADAFFEAMTADRLAGRLAAPHPTGPGSTYRITTALDSLVGYIRLHHLTRAWPFRPEEAQPFRAGPDIPPEVVELAEAYYANRMEWQEATFRLAAFWEEREAFNEALRARRALVQAYPFVGQHLTALGNLQLRMAQELGRPALFAEAEASFRAALARDARDGRAATLLGALLLNRRAPTEAIPVLERAVRLDPRDLQALYNLAGAYALTGRHADARRAGRQVLAVQPGHPGATALLASLPGG